MRAGLLLTADTRLSSRQEPGEVSARNADHRRPGRSLYARPRAQSRPKAYPRPVSPSSTADRRQPAQDRPARRRVAGAAGALRPGVARPDPPQERAEPAQPRRGARPRRAGALQDAAHQPRARGRQGLRRRAAVVSRAATVCEPVRRHRRASGRSHRAARWRARAGREAIWSSPGRRQSCVSTLHSTIGEGAAHATPEAQARVARAVNPSI